MIKFIHTYTEKSIDTLLASGLFRQGHGLKLMHKPVFTPPVDFNTVAREDEKLHGILEDLACPFYIDRLQGGLGSPVKYNYDKALLKHYRDHEKIDFLGLQMHEWASNFRSDMKRIAELCAKEGIAPAEVHNRTDFWEKVQDGTFDLFLEAYTPAEWSGLPLPKTREEFLSACEELFKKRIRETDGLLFTTDSYYMTHRTAIANGVKMLLPEVGWQIPNTRLQIAYTRGMAKSAGIPWGIYYECWYCDEHAHFTIPYSMTDDVDDWRETFGEKGYGCERPMQQRQHGGSSLSMAERIWVYAYFSGAQLMGEEYGICNTLVSTNSMQLSPYGEAKKRFIELTERYTPSGEAYKPFAVVLPAEMEMLDERLAAEYLDFPCDEFFTQEYMQHFNTAMEDIFGKTAPHGNMNHTVRNAGLPDLAEIVHDDMDEALSQYTYLIDLTGKKKLQEKYSNIVTADEAKALAKTLLPVLLPDNLHITARKNNNNWQLLLMNNNGVQHQPFAPDVILPEAQLQVKIELKNKNATIRKKEGTATLTAESGEYFAHFNGGDWIIIETEE